MNYSVQRLTQCVQVVRLWPFFVEGFHFVGRYRKYSLTVDNFRRALLVMVKDPTAWVGVAFDEAVLPCAFWCANETTPPYAGEREFEVTLRFHRTNCIDASLALQKAFDTWCTDEDVTRYFLTTRRDDSKGPRRFRADLYGLERAYTVFKKELSHA